MIKHNEISQNNSNINGSGLKVDVMTSQQQNLDKNVSGSCLNKYNTFGSSDTNIRYNTNNNVNGGYGSINSCFSGNYEERLKIEIRKNELLKAEIETLKFRKESGDDEYAKTIEQQEIRISELEVQNQKFKEKTEFLQKQYDSNRENSENSSFLKNELDSLSEKYNQDHCIFIEKISNLEDENCSLNQNYSIIKTENLELKETLNYLEEENRADLRLKGHLTVELQEKVKALKSDNNSYKSKYLDLKKDHDALKKNLEMRDESQYNSLSNQIKILEDKNFRQKETITNQHEEHLIDSKAKSDENHNLQIEITTAKTENSSNIVKAKDKIRLLKQKYNQAKYSYEDCLTKLQIQKSDLEEIKQSWKVKEDVINDYQKCQKDKDKDLEILKENTQIELGESEENLKVLQDNFDLLQSEHIQALNKMKLANKIENKFMNKAKKDSQKINKLEDENNVLGDNVKQLQEEQDVSHRIIRESENVRNDTDNKYKAKCTNFLLHIKNNVLPEVKSLKIEISELKNRFGQKINSVVECFFDIMYNCDSKLAKRQLDLNYLEDNFKQLSDVLNNLKENYNSVVKSKATSNNTYRNYEENLIPKVTGLLTPTNTNYKTETELEPDVSDHNFLTYSKKSHQYCSNGNVISLYQPGPSKAYYEKLQNSLKKASDKKTQKQKEQEKQLEHENDYPGTFGKQFNTYLNSSEQRNEKFMSSNSSEEKQQHFIKNKLDGYREVHDRLKHEDSHNKISDSLNNHRVNKGTSGVTCTSTYHENTTFRTLNSRNTIQRQHHSKYDRDTSREVQPSDHSRFYDRLKDSNRSHLDISRYKEGQTRTYDENFSRFVTPKPMRFYADKKNSEGTSEMNDNRRSQSNPSMKNNRLLNK